MSPLEEITLCTLWQIAVKRFGTDKRNVGIAVRCGMTVKDLTGHAVRSAILILQGRTPENDPYLATYAPVGSAMLQEVERLYGASVPSVDWIDNATMDNLLSVLRG